MAPWNGPNYYLDRGLQVDSVRCVRSACKTDDNESYFNAESSLWHHHSRHLCKRNGVHYMYIRQRHNTHTIYFAYDVGYCLKIQNTNR